MKKEEHEQAIQDIINTLNKQGVDTTTISDLIQSIRENYTEIYDTNEENSIALEKANEDIKKRKETNLNLLLKLGKQALNDDKKKDDVSTQTNTDEEEEEEKEIDINKFVDEMEVDL